MRESDKARAERFKKALIENARLFEKLEEAMASPERIKEDIAYCGGFVSAIDLVCTAEEVIDRAIVVIKLAQKEGIV